MARASPREQWKAIRWAVLALGARWQYLLLRLSLGLEEGGMVGVDGGRGLKRQLVGAVHRGRRDEQLRKIKTLRQPPVATRTREG